MHSSSRYSLDWVQPAKKSRKHQHEPFFLVLHCWPDCLCLCGVKKERKTPPVSSLSLPLSLFPLDSASVALTYNLSKETHLMFFDLRVFRVTVDRFELRHCSCRSCFFFLHRFLFGVLQLIDSNCCFCFGLKTKIIKTKRNTTASSGKHNSENGSDVLNMQSSFFLQRLMTVWLIQVLILSLSLSFWEHDWERTKRCERTWLCKGRVWDVLGMIITYFI